MSTPLEEKIKKMKMNGLKIPAKHLDKQISCQCFSCDIEKNILKSLDKKGCQTYQYLTSCPENDALRYFSQQIGYKLCEQNKFHTFDQIAAAIYKIYDNGDSIPNKHIKQRRVELGYYSTRYLLFLDLIEQEQEIFEIPNLCNDLNSNDGPKLRDKCSKLSGGFLEYYYKKSNTLNIDVTLLCYGGKHAEYLLQKRIIKNLNYGGKAYFINCICNRDADRRSVIIYKNIQLCVNVMYDHLLKIETKYRFINGAIIAAEMYIAPLRNDDHNYTNTKLLFLLEETIYYHRINKILYEHNNSIEGFYNYFASIIKNTSLIYLVNSLPRVDYLFYYVMRYLDVCKQDNYAQNNNPAAETNF